MRRIRPRTLLLGIVAAIAVTAGAGAAAIPSSSGAVNGCYERITGILRVIDTDSGKSCKSFENAIVWSVRGPQGPAGATGPKGDPGATTKNSSSSRNSFPIPMLIKIFFELVMTKLPNIIFPLPVSTEI